MVASFHINPNIWISVLINAQSTTRMLTEDVDKSRSC